MNITNKNEIYLKFSAFKIADKKRNKIFQEQVQKIACFLNNRYFNSKSKSIKLIIFCTAETVKNDNSMIMFKFN